VSGPARRPAPAARPRIARRGGLLLGLLSALERLASHRLLDRLIRGRAWLVLVTFALIGIVTLQLALLKLNGAVGRALHSAALLQRENAALSIENSELAAADRVQAGATQLGMAFASSASLRFLAPSSNGDFARGAAALNSPLHAPGAGSEGGSASPGATSSAGEGAPEAGAGTSEAKRSEAPAGEAEASSSATGGGSEASSTRSSTPAASGEAPAAAQAPEAPSASESSPAGGTQATPSG
jgi:cell division protein FtsL